MAAKCDAVHKCNILSRRKKGCKYEVSKVALSRLLTWDFHLLPALTHIKYIDLEL